MRSIPLQILLCHTYLHMEITQELTQYPTVHVACYIAPSGFLSNRLVQFSTQAIQLQSVMVFDSSPGTLP